MRKMQGGGRVGITPMHQRGLFVLLAGSWVTGVLFFIFNKWVRIPSDFGPTFHPAQQWFLVIHGACAFGMMMAYGALLATHVNATLRYGMIRQLGIGLVASFATLIITAYGLYYVSSTTVREWVGYVHAAVGFMLPLVLFLHIKTAIKTSKKKRSLT